MIDNAATRITPRMGWDELSDHQKAEGGYWIYPMKGLVWSSKMAFVRVDNPAAEEARS